ncbi:MAG: 50S ribosome-binding protein YggL [Maioricimonas sp. JB049]
MKKRLRKKKYLGEFRQFGFSASCRLRENLSTADFDRFTDCFIEQAIEAHGLVFAGGGSHDTQWSGVICREHRYDSTTEADRAAVRDWLDQCADIASYRLSEPWDVWHGHAPFD